MDQVNFKIINSKLENYSSSIMSDITSTNITNNSKATLNIKLPPKNYLFLVIILKIIFTIL